MLRISRIATASCLLLVLTHLPADADPRVDQLPYKSSELIVRFKDQDRVSSSLSARKSSLLRTYKRFPLHHVRLPEGVTVPEALTAYRADPNVLYAEPNYRAHKLALPNDPLLSQQWNLTTISAPTAWNSFTGSRGTGAVIVAILDTGVAYTHPDLTQNLWTNPGEICGDGIDNDHNGIVDDCYGANFGGTSAGDPWDDDTTDSHGTHLAGIVGAVGNNGLGVSGVNWAARIMAVKFLHGPEGAGDLSDALRSVDYALANGARIINMSFEISGDSQSLREAIATADAAGVLVVSAAGNSAQNLDTSSVYPASIRSANNMVVAAATRSDRLASYSDYGQHTVDLAAPGGEQTGSPNAILSTVWLNNGGTLYRSTAGTSMAPPHVAGAAALIWNMNPSLSAYQVRARLMNGVDRLAAFNATTITGGRLNLATAMNSIDLPTVFSVTPWTAAAGDTITISGANFGTNQGTVTLGNTVLTTTAWSDRGITATLPTGVTSGVLSVNGGSGFPVTVTSSSGGGDGGGTGGGGGKGGGCFIATAAWGSPLHPKVALLRTFRDQHLLTNGPGRLFVRTYYAVSPPLADFIARHEQLRSATRWALTPLVLAVVHPLPAAALLLALLLTTLFFLRKHHVQLRAKASRE